MYRSGFKRPALTFIFFLVLLITVNNIVSLPSSDTSSTIPNNNLMMTNDTTIGHSKSCLDSNHIPPKYDSRSKNVITKIKDQNTSNSCWAFATMSVLESDYISQGFGTVNNTDFSEAHLVSFAHNSMSDDFKNESYNDGLNVAFPYVSGGNWYASTAVLSRWSGIAQEKTYPFPKSDVATGGVFAEDARYVNDAGVIIKSAEMLDENNDKEIKKWIMEHGSVAVSLCNEPEYYYNGPAGYAYYYNGEKEQDHQLVIIGWDDNFSVSNFNPDCRPKSAGAWLCKDSQGTKWGNDGFTWISYETNGLYCFIGFTCQPAEKYDNNYTYNGYGWSTYLKCSNNAYAANVFKSKSSEILKAVSFYTLQPNASVQISVYTNLPKHYTDPTQGALQYASKDIVFSNCGYHTVDLSKDVKLSPDEIFSVIIRYGHDSGEVQIPIESKNNLRNATYVSKQGESFVYTTNINNKWNDTQSCDLCNVCIQAFTKKST